MLLKVEIEINHFGIAVLFHSTIQEQCKFFFLDRKDCNLLRTYNVPQSDIYMETTIITFSFMQIITHI